MLRASSAVGARTEASDSEERAFSVFSLSSGRAAVPVAPSWVRGPHDLRYIAGDAVAVVAPENREAFLEDASDLLAEVAGQDRWMTVLVPWKEPPVDGRRNDGQVLSFIAGARVVRDAATHLERTDWPDLCYSLLHGLLNGLLDVPRVCVRQIGRAEKPRPLTRMSRRAALIMAHRGPRAYLDTALSYINRAASAPMITARVGLDEPDADAYRLLASRYPAYQIHAIDTPPVGPYVIRQALVERSHEELLVFQDSDDISSFDRFVVQQAEMDASGADLVGCQEIEVDEIDKAVVAYRFPRDVSLALSDPASMESCHSHQEPLLHATAMMRRQSFLDAGGLSTDQRIANDTQFMLRAYFSVKMRNSEEFLYIRRRHAKALTVAAPTAAGCELRRNLASAWQRDFEALKRGIGSLPASTLWPRASATPHVLTPVDSGLTESASRRTV